MPRPTKPNPPRWFFYLSVFMTGMTTLAAEFSASRLVQTAYGTSNLVWANVIGLVLLALTAGYFIGGRWADRRPDVGVFYWLLLAAGVATVACLLLTSVLLRRGAAALAALDVGVVAASLLVSGAALALPVTLLGCVTPFAVRLAVTDVAEAGRISGRLYAFATWGSLLGTYLPVLVTIPLVGTRLTVIIFGGALATVGAVGVWLTRGSAAPLALWLLLLLPVLWLGSRGTLKATSGLLLERESAYNYIQVVARDDCRLLLLNEGAGVHSVACSERRVPPDSVWGVMAAAPYFRPNPTADRIAIVGLAAGTLAQLYHDSYGSTVIDGIEIDPAIVEIGRTHFDLDAVPVNVIIGDGRHALSELDGGYDVVLLDAYRVPYIPWHMTTVEFFTLVRAKLAPDGVAALNVGRVEDDRRLVEALTATLQAVFPAVYTVDVPGSYNTVLVAANQTHASTAIDTFTTADNRWLDAVVAAALAGRVPSRSSAMLFTDDRAAVETLIDTLVLRALWEDGLAVAPLLPE